EHLVGDRLEQRAASPLAPLEFEEELVALDLQADRGYDDFDLLGFVRKWVLVDERGKRVAVPIDRRDGTPGRCIELARIPVDVRVCPHGFPAPDQELRRRIVQPPPDALLQLDRDEQIPSRSPRRGNGDGRHVTIVALAEVATEYG